MTRPALAETTADSDAIARADIYVLSAPIDPPSGVSIGLATAHEYVLVRLTDTAGRTGWGESYLLPGLAQTVEALAAMLVGQPVGRIRDHRRVLASTRASSYAQSAVFIALDDLRARQLGVPIHRLYGGPTRESVEAYAASQGYVQDVPLEETWSAETERFLALGFTAMKLRVGRFPIEREAAALARVRERIGGATALMVDGNGGYSAGEAVRMGRELSALGVRWFEEPLPQVGYRGYAELRLELDLPLAGGEVLESLDEARELATTRAVDILQPDVVICGGIGAALAVADLAVLHGIPTVPHTSGGAIGIAATLQLLAVLDDANRSPGSEGLLLEFGQGENPWRTDVLQAPFELRDGRLDIPTGPGLGVEVDTDLVVERAVLHLEVTS